MGNTLDINKAVAGNEKVFSNKYIYKLAISGENCSKIFYFCDLNYNISISKCMNYENRQFL